MTGILTSANPTDWKSIGSILGNDTITLVHITNLLRAQDIEAAIQGSRTYDIAVPVGQVEQASEVLRSDAAKRDYYISFGSDEVVNAPELKEVVHGVSVSSLLKRTDYASETAFGRFLRTGRISQLAVKYPYMFSLCLHERRYLATPHTHSTGWHVKFELHRSARKRADGCCGWCQLLEDGRNVDFHGGFSEWGSLLEG